MDKCMTCGGPIAEYDEDPDTCGLCVMLFGETDPLDRETKLMSPSHVEQDCCDDED
jgi:hypothetical protein